MKTTQEERDQLRRSIGQSIDPWPVNPGDILCLLDDADELARKHEELKIANALVRHHRERQDAADMELARLREGLEGLGRRYPYYGCEMVDAKFLYREFGHSTEIPHDDAWVEWSDIRALLDGEG